MAGRSPLPTFEDSVDLPADGQGVERRAQSGRILELTALLGFRRQHATGQFIVDFYWSPARLAIEIHGQRTVSERVSDGLVVSSYPIQALPRPSAGRSA